MIVLLEYICALYLLAVGDVSLSQCAESSAKQDKQNLLHNAIVKLTSYMELQANYNKYDVK